MAADKLANPQPSAALRFDGDTLYLSGVLNFETVISFDGAVADWLKGRSGSDCIADLAEVQYSNSAGIALLLSWMRLAAAAGRVSPLIKPSARARSESLQRPCRSIPEDSRRAA